MKIAVCLSGQYRTFDKTYETWQRYLLSQYDCDIYLHTWDIIGNRVGKGDTHVTEDTSRLLYTEEQLEKKYHLQKVCIESYTSPLEEFIQKSARVKQIRDSIPANAYKINYSQRRILHLYSMWYKALRCFEMMEQQQIQYDIIIKCRPDIQLVDYLSLADMDVDKINWFWYNNNHTDYMEPHDYFALGTPNVMRPYHQLYNHIQDMEDILEIEKEHMSPSRMHGIERMLNAHTLLYYYVKWKKLPTHTIQKKLVEILR
jgi:hypothetical protein